MSMAALKEQISGYHKMPRDRNTGFHYKEHKMPGHPHTYKVEVTQFPQTPDPEYVINILRATQGVPGVSSIIRMIVRYDETTNELTQLSDSRLRVWHKPSPETQETYLLTYVEEPDTEGTETRRARLESIDLQLYDGHGTSYPATPEEILAAGITEDRYPPVIDPYATGTMWLTGKIPNSSGEPHSVEDFIAHVEAHPLVAVNIE